MTKYLSLLERISKLEKLVGIRETTEPNKEILDKAVEGTYEVDANKVINVKGNVKLLMMDLGSILEKVGQFGSVTGTFDCRSNKLKNLEGSPKSTGGFFSCARNDLTNLKSSPASVGGNFDCSKNKLDSLEGCPKTIGNVFNLSGQKSTRIFKEKDVQLVCKIDKSKIVI